jgi:hypothetical protein
MSKAEKILKKWRESSSKQDVKISDVLIVIEEYLPDLFEDRRGKGGSHHYIIRHSRLNELNIGKFDCYTIPVKGKVIRFQYVKKLLSIIDLRQEGEI